MAAGQGGNETGSGNGGGGNRPASRISPRDRLNLAQTPEGSLALLTGSLIGPVRTIVDGGAITSLLTGGLLLIIFDLVHRAPLGEYITANAVGGALLLTGGLLAWAGHRSNARERLAALEANKALRLAGLTLAEKPLPGTDGQAAASQTPGPVRPVF